MSNFFYLSPNIFFSDGNAPHWAGSSPPGADLISWRDIGTLKMIVLLTRWKNILTLIPYHHQCDNKSAVNSCCLILLLAAGQCQTIKEPHRPDKHQPIIHLHFLINWWLVIILHYIHFKWSMINEEATCLVVYHITDQMHYWRTFDIVIMFYWSISRHPQILKWSLI